jgi:hypothetical protein
MQIFVTLPDTTSIALDVEVSDTILGVKSKIQIQTGIPAPQQILTYNNITLVDTITLTDYNIQKNSIIILAVAISYTNIYVKPFLAVDQRTYWSEFINDQSIFVPEYLYQPVDPEIKMVLEYGIQQLNLAEYAASLNNVYRRKLNFGKVKIAQGKDTTENHIYDAVYVEIIDEMQGVKQSVTMHNKIYYPSSIDNMRLTLESIKIDNTLIEVDKTQLPRFMQTAQTGSYIPTEYIPVIVLCYTTPKDGSKIISRIKKSKFDFKLLDFEVDRIFVETSLDNEADKYLLFNRKSITDIQ